MSGLDDTALQRVRQELQVRTLDAGSVVCRAGEPTRNWVGVFSGLLLAVRDAERPMAGMNAVAPGGWVGEDTLAGHEPWPDDVVALRKSHVGLLPADTYFWLREHSLAFNHVLLARLEQRVRQCMRNAQPGRPNGADERVAQSLLGLFDPVLHPAVGQSLRITQEELAEICRLSRQRVNQALQRLASGGLLRLRYGGIELSSAQGLRDFIGHAAPTAQFAVNGVSAAMIELPPASSPAGDTRWA